MDSEIKNPVSKIANIVSRSASLSLSNKAPGSIYWFGDLPYALEYDVGQDIWNRREFEIPESAAKGKFFNNNFGYNIS